MSTQNHVLKFNSYSVNDVNGKIFKDLEQVLQCIFNADISRDPF